jgi:hypothetical protein
MAGMMKSKSYVVEPNESTIFRCEVVESASTLTKTLLAAAYTQKPLAS